MRKLTFVAKGDLLVGKPKASHSENAPRQYVGRILKDGAYPAKSTPDTFSDPDSVRRLLKLMRREDCLIPFDPETAKACGKKFIPHEFNDGEWVPVKKSSKQSQS